MTTGTKSILFGTHQFFIHPFFVLLGYIKHLKKIPSLKMGIAIFVHDWGYWGCEKIISEEGSKHPERSAKIIKKIFPHYSMEYNYAYQDIIYKKRRMRVYNYGWHLFDLIKYHSEEMADGYFNTVSPLYFADKLGAIMTPIWLYSILAVLSGESKEYWEYLEEKISLRDFFKRYKLWVRASVASYLGESFYV